MLKSAAAAVNNLFNLQRPEEAEADGKLKEAILEEMQQLNMTLEQQEKEFKQQYAKIGTFLLIILSRHRK